MNIASFFANKCFELLLEKGMEGSQSHDSKPDHSQHAPLTYDPPWISDINFFKQNCDGCGKCVTSCENNILFIDKAGYPRVDFSQGECSFCGDCAKNCPQDIFDYGESILPWNLKATITLDCLSHNNVLCRTCVEHCEMEAIKIPKTNGTLGAPFVLTEMCDGCGACFSPCPVRAVKITSNEGGQEMILNEEENR